MTFVEEPTVKPTQRSGRNERPMAGSREPVTGRRAFWVFLTIFSVTIFALSAYMASGYLSCRQTAERLSLPTRHTSFSANMAATSGLGVALPADPADGAPSAE